VITALAATGAAACGGCLQRRIVVTSEPEGAVVWINHQEVGRAPVETGFTFYGKYDVRLRKEGYEPVAAAKRAKSPWYEYPGPDLIASALPFRFRKTIRWHFDLEPLPEPTPANRAALVRRADEFRDRVSDSAPPTAARSANPG
jgi:hypothetical protein